MSIYQIIVRADDSRFLETFVMKGDRTLISEPSFTHGYPSEESVKVLEIKRLIEIKPQPGTG